MPIRVIRAILAHFRAAPTANGPPFLHRNQPSCAPPAVDPAYAVERVRAPAAAQAYSPHGTAKDVLANRPPPVDPLYAREVVSSFSANARPEPGEVSDAEIWRRFMADVDPVELERIVLAAYECQGYQVQPTPKTGDHGLDGILRREREPKIGVQVKRWKRAVTGPNMREFVGSLRVARLKAGIYLTTGKVSRNASEYAAGNGVEIVQGLDMRQFLLRHVRDRVLAVVKGR